MSRRLGYCDCCRSEDVLISQHGQCIQVDLCDICAATDIGNTAISPGRYPDGTAQILKAIGYCTNLILKKIKEER